MYVRINTNLIILVFFRPEIHQGILFHGGDDPSTREPHFVGDVLGWGTAGDGNRSRRAKVKHTRK